MFVNILYSTRYYVLHNRIDICSEHHVTDQLCLEEPGDVEEGAEDDDGDHVPRHPPPDRGPQRAVAVGVGPAHRAVPDNIFRAFKIIFSSITIIFAFVAMWRCSSSDHLFPLFLFTSETILVPGINHVLHC